MIARPVTVLPAVVVVKEVVSIVYVVVIAVVAVEYGVVVAVAAFVVFVRLLSLFLLLSMWLALLFDR